tara:strand:- start:341 stop:3457 length:3117 start_codon:yes stop_codon:yes gene_type:complete
MAKLSTYLTMHQEGLLGRAARTFNSGNLVSTEYLAPSGTVVGEQCLFIEYIYDANGNIVSEDKSIEIWGSTQETIAESTTNPSPATQANSIVSTDGNEAGVTVGGRLKVDADLTGGTVNVTATSLDIEDITITDVGTTDDSLKVKHTGDVSTKNQTQYSDSTSNTQYWLGLEEDNQLTLQYVDDSVSNQKTIFYALPSVSIDGSCLARRYYLADDEVTGEHTYIGTWTQAMNDRIKPPPTDITVASGSLTTVEDQVATTVLAGLGVVGGESPVTLSMTSNGGLSVEISGANLVVASGGIDGSASGSSPFTVGIRATDVFGAIYDENLSVTVTTNDITDIALSALTVLNNAVDGDDIGNLTCTGGVGDVSYAITSNGGLDNLKITDTGTSTATLEVDTGGIIDSTGTYTIRITATDTIAQTYYEDFDITVTPSYTNSKSLDLNANGVDPDFKSNHIQETSGLFNSHLTASTPFGVSTWLKTNTDPATTPAVVYPTRYFDIPTDASWNGSQHGNGIGITDLGIEDGGILHSGPVGEKKPWSFSFWCKDPTTDRYFMTMNGDQSNFELHFRISSNGQLRIEKDFIGSIGAEFLGSLDDGDWHHVIVSYKHTDASDNIWDGSTYNWYVDPYLNGPNTGTYDDMGFTVFIDGARAAYDTVNSTGLTQWEDDVYYCPNESSTVDTMVLGQYFHSWKRHWKGKAANVAFHDETISAAKAATLYNSGNPTDLSADPNCIVLLNPEGLSAGASIAYDTVLTNNGGASSSSDHTCTVLHNSGDTIPWTLEAEDASGESLYYEMTPAVTTSAPVIFRNGGKTGTAPNEVFGEGITVSISDKYADSTGAYVSAGAQDPKLVISFDGFEDDADKVLVYDNDVTDNTWKNIVVTYDSSATDNKDRISLYVNNVEQTPLGTPSITFTGNDNYFKNVSDTATNTTIGGSGFDAASANSIYALQAEIDSISLHSEALSSAMVTELYDSGVPANLLDESLTSDHTKIETWVSFEDETDNGTTAQDETDNNKDMTLVNMASGDYVTLTVLDSIYYNP